MASSTKWAASRPIFAGHFSAFALFWSRDENNEISSIVQREAQGRGRRADALLAKGAALLLVELVEHVLNVGGI